MASREKQHIPKHPGKSLGRKEENMLIDAEKSFVLFDGVEPPKKKSYAEYSFLFKNAEDFGTWNDKTNNLKETKDDEYC